MLRRQTQSAKSWTPAGFEQYLHWFPKTKLEPQSNQATLSFIEQWEQVGDAMSRAQIAARLRGTRVVFARGFLGRWLLGNLNAPTRALSEAGVDACILNNSSGGECRNNVQAMVSGLGRRETKPFIVCGHSRAGLEALLTLDLHPELARLCKGVLLSQTPRAPSPVLQHLFKNEDARLRRWVADVGLSAGIWALGARRGAAELGGPGLVQVIDQVSDRFRPFPVVQTASWSIQPTVWLDSFHERLGEILPGEAHDGQFFLHDLIWPELPNVLLPQVDHAQPAVGGAGFDHVRYWWALLGMLLRNG